MLCFLLIGMNIIGQTIISNNGKYGVLDNDSREDVAQNKYLTILNSF